MSGNWMMRMRETGGYELVDEDGDTVDVSLLGQISINSRSFSSGVEFQCEPPYYLDNPEGIVAQAMKLRDAAMPEGRVVIDTIRIVSKYADE